jgi:hypothetical protein
MKSVCLFFVYFHTVAPVSVRFGMTVGDLLGEVLDDENHPPNWKTSKAVSCLLLKNNFSWHIEASSVD